MVASTVEESPYTAIDNNNNTADSTLLTKALARAFVLDANSEWVTVATGVAIPELSENGQTLTVALHEEDEYRAVLFSATFHKDQDISRQQATVVTWTSGDGSDVALSFEHENGCDSFWVEVCKFLGRPSEYSLPSEDMTDEGINFVDEDAKNGADEEEQVHGELLPEDVEFNTIPDIDDALSRALNSTAEFRRLICIRLIQRSYISKLLDLFRIAEDLEARETLFRIFSIFKCLILLNNSAILRDLLSEEHILHVAGVFEHDPEYPEAKPGYRQFLLNRDRFKQILEFNDEKLVELIHQTFRLQYLKDVVLPRILDEETFSSLLFMVRCNFAEVLEILENDEDFVKKLLPLFKSESLEECESVLKFMKEFLTIAKSAANGRNLGIYRGSSFSEFLRFIQRMLYSESGECQFLVIDIIIAISQLDSNTIRSFMMDSKDLPLTDQLLTTIIDRINSVATEYSLRWQLVAILRTLLDSSYPIGLAIPNDEFLNFFYPNYALRLLDPLTQLEKHRSSAATTGGEELHFSPDEADVYFNCCELLCSFIIQHKYRIKYLLFRSFIVHNVLVLLRSAAKFLKLSAIRVIRTMIGTGDDFYFRFFMKQTLLKPLVDQSVALGTADNALTSALIEFFHFIRDRKYKLLITHLVETYRGELEAIQFAPIFATLQNCYRDLNNPQSSSISSEANEIPEGPLVRSRPRDTWLGIDRDEEAYFSSGYDEAEEEEERDEEREGEGEERGEEPAREQRDSRVGLEEGLEDLGGNYSPKSHTNERTVPDDCQETLPATIKADEIDIPAKMATVWQEEVDRNKRMKF